MKYTICIFVVCFAGCLVAQTPIVEKGGRLFLEWNEVTTLQSGTAWPTSRADFYYQAFAAPIVGGVADWSQSRVLLSNDFQPAFEPGQDKVNALTTVELPKAQYNLIINCYRYSRTDGRKLESNPSNTVSFEVIDPEQPPATPVIISLEVRIPSDDEQQ